MNAKYQTKKAIEELMDALESSEDVDISSFDIESINYQTKKPVRPQLILTGFILIFTVICISSASIYSVKRVAKLERVVTSVQDEKSSIAYERDQIYAKLNTAMLELKNIISERKHQDAEYKNILLQKKETEQNLEQLKKSLSRHQEFLAKAQVGISEWKEQYKLIVQALLGSRTYTYTQDNFKFEIVNSDFFEGTVSLTIKVTNTEGKRSIALFWESPYELEFKLEPIAVFDNKKFSIPSRMYLENKEILNETEFREAVSVEIGTGKSANIKFVFLDVLPGATTMTLLRFGYRIGDSETDKYITMSNVKL